MVKVETMLKDGKNIKKISLENPRFDYYVTDIMSSIWDGDKFHNSFGITRDYDGFVDYYILRKRSMQLFRENPYARGMIRRLIQNEINKGQTLEANPFPEIIGLSEDEAVQWAEKVELDWFLWSNDPYLVDWKYQKNLSELAADARQTALISGDALIVLHVNQFSGLPAVEIIDGVHVVTPFGVTVREGNRIVHGVELDSKDRQVAYWVESFQNGAVKYNRLPAFGEKSGRRIAWMIYGCDKRLDDVRGEPILALMLYMLKDLDRYRDAASRAAVVNSIYPFLIKRTEKGSGGNPLGSGASRRETEPATENYTTRKISFGNDLPGTIQELPYGIDVTSLNVQKSDINFAKFEETIINVFSWVLCIPPEVVRLLFQSSYSASRQANNEFNVYLQYRFQKHGEEFYKPIYVEKMVASVLSGEIETPGFLEAWRQNNWKVYNAWLNAEWSGLSRPSVDLGNDVNAGLDAIAGGIATFDSQSRKLFGKSFRNTIQIRAREKALMEKYGIISSVDETTTGEPVSENPKEIKINKKAVALLKDDIINGINENR